MNLASSAAPSAAPPNPLRALAHYGQSVWLDYIRRNLLVSGELERLVREDGLRGITSNPAIFEKAITGSTDYAAALNEAHRQRLSAIATYEGLAIEDIRQAAQIFAPLYRDSGARDGYVSLEVSPYLAHDCAGTLNEARRLWRAVDRPNLMIKIPATREGIQAVEMLIGEGLNINVTLIFSLDTYERVAQAFLRGLELRQRSGAAIAGIASVASFFISRIDAVIDPLLTQRVEHAAGEERQSLESLQGTVAIANARLAYERYQQLFGGARWRALSGQGAQPQRLLWASTGTKNPRYRDTRYVEELIGPETVNTIPPATYDAFRAHGRSAETLTQGVADASTTLATLARVGISIDSVTRQLLDDGLTQFREAFDKLLAVVDSQCRRPTLPPVRRQTLHLGENLHRAFDQELQSWIEEGKSHRLWARDATLWSASTESQWLGWLGLLEEGHDELTHTREVAELAREFAHVVLLGMGGSSLAPEVFRDVFGAHPDGPAFHVLDSTDPAQISALAQRIDLPRTLFIVSSKSGNTLEPNIFQQYFFALAERVLGVTEAPRHFIAITDPGSTLEAAARAANFRAVFHGVPSIGGRYSALSNFGILPAAAMGIDVGRLLDRTRAMVHSCAGCVAPADNPAVLLGLALGVAARHGKDKLTIVASPRLWPFAPWLEQLLAESTGKGGRGVIPIVGELLSNGEHYGSDRLFVRITLKGDSDSAQLATLEALESAGHPVITILVDSVYDLGQEFFRWAFATAVAGTVLGINPFDQPDVEASKIATRELTAAYERAGCLPSEVPLYSGEGVQLFADRRNTSDLLGRVAADGELSLQGLLRAHFARIRADDYAAFLAYLEMSPANVAALRRIRLAVRDAKRVATCVGFGPRFLHSTGQAYKGGPNTAVVLQVTCQDARDLAVPGRRYTFGVVKAAQARGDFQVLGERDRRVLRIHLPADVQEGLDILDRAIRAALTVAS